MNKMNFAKETVYRCNFSKDINMNKSFHVPDDCQDDLLYRQLHPEFSFIGESECFHLMDNSFNLSLS